MSNEKVVRGLALIAVALFFGIKARASYTVGTFGSPGPGLFPICVSGLLGLIGLVMIVQSRFEAGARLKIRLRGILIVTASLIGFVLITHYLNMIVAVVFLVFFSTLAGANYSVVRNVKVCAVLIAIAFALRGFLGLQLPLY